MTSSFPLVAQELREAFDRAIASALDEDLRAGDPTSDLTTWPIVDEATWGRAEVWVKEPGMICGLDALDATFAAIDERANTTLQRKDGDELRAADVVAIVEGPARAILVGERTALNLLAHLSGIATGVRTFVEAAPAVELTDTRKTLPGLRVLQKYAVRVGGGSNHRFGLFDGILVKDNHIVAAGGVGEAVRRVRQSSSLPVEVECSTQADVEEALQAGAAAILLDNLEPDELRTLSSLIKSQRPHVLVEASGSVTLGNLAAVASSGVDRVSIGAFTHSARALDVSLKLVDVWRRD